MKKNSSLLGFPLQLMLAAGVCAAMNWQVAEARGADSNDAFPHVIPVELGASAFAAGDDIAIGSLRGTHAHLDSDGSWLVEGSYTLASAEKATLLFSCTTSGPSQPTPLLPEQEMTVTRGSGHFALRHGPSAGFYHVSFYVAGENHSHGGVYFGEKGVESTLLRKTDWPDLAGGRAEAKAKTDRNPDEGSSEANRAIMAYLGQSVAAPADLDLRYVPSNVFSVFVKLSQKAGWPIKSVAVDDSEFPYLLYGTLEGEHHLEHDALNSINGYDYGGSVVGRTSGGGGKGTTYFALNLIPREAWPASDATACERRLMIRLQMLAEAARRRR
jgi:hypothetical protein